MARRFKRKYGVTPLERILIILLIAVVVGATLGVILPRINNGIAEITGRYTATGTAAETLNKLAVVDRPNGDGYDRDLFGFRETDDDGNGCDVREDILARDLTDVAYVTRNGCKVKSGVLNDPYTGKVIHFTRGQNTSAAVQIDHVVALQNAWQSGAKDWNARKRMHSRTIRIICSPWMARRTKAKAPPPPHTGCRQTLRIAAITWPGKSV